MNNQNFNINWIAYTSKTIIWTNLWILSWEMKEYQLRSKKRVTQIRTRKATWSIKGESLEENAKPNITARDRPIIKKVNFRVNQVGPWNGKNERIKTRSQNRIKTQNLVQKWIQRSRRDSKWRKGGWIREIIVRTLTPGAKAPRRTALADDTSSLLSDSIFHTNAHTREFVFSWFQLFCNFNLHLQNNIYFFLVVHLHTLFLVVWNGFWRWEGWASQIKKTVGTFDFGVV